MLFSDSGSSSSGPTLLKGNTFFHDQKMEVVGVVRFINLLLLLLIHFLCQNFLAENTLQLNSYSIFYFIISLFLKNLNTFLENVLELRC